MTTTVRMVHSTMDAMPTARLMKEKLRASREAISAVTMSPLAIAVRTYGMMGSGGGVVSKKGKNRNKGYETRRQKRKSKREIFRMD